MLKKIKNKKNLYRIFFFFYLFSYILFPNYTFAFDIPIPGVGTAMVDIPAALQEVENRYGINPNILRNAQRKESAPRVEIFFDNTNPKPGEKVTAHATPEFFKNDPQNLYYTWYIIHTQSKSGTPGWQPTNSVRDGKIEAAGIMARGDYDPKLDGQTYADPGKDPDNDGWPTIDSGKYDQNKSAAPMGGADGVGGLEKGSDNIEPYADAGAYCDSKGNHGLTDCNLYTNKSAFNQYYNLMPDQSGDYCKACQQTMSFTSTLSPDNQCCYLIANPSDTGFTGYDASVNYCPSAYQSAYESCFDYNGLQSTNSTAITSCLNSQYQSCKNSWNGLHKNLSGNEPVSQVSRCYKHNFGTNNPDIGFRGYTGSSSSSTTDTSGTDVVTDCTHKWPNEPDGYKLGSGKFTTAEEKYWKTDPADPDTNGDGVPDGAAVLGLNQQTFTWNYQSGDRVGVVVEGTSLIPVDESSAYYKIMWGYPDVCDSTKKDLMDNDECDSSDDYGYGYLATVAPSEQGDDKLKFSLSFSPDNPLADPSDDNKDNITSDGTISDADQITVTSSLDNTNDNPSDLYYTWQIQKGDPQKDNWGNPLDISSNFDTTSPASGMGISQFSFTPKKGTLSSSSGLNYFKVTLTGGKAADLAAGRGRTSVIIPVNTQGVKIALHKVDIKNGKATVGDEICNDGLYKSLCPVVKGQMLAAQVSGSHYSSADSTFSWTVDGSPAYPPANADQLFDGWNNTTIFFPITQDEQGIENISVTATSKNELQPATGTRLATVVHPALFIKSGDGSLSWPKVYTAEDPTKKYSMTGVESQDFYEALASKDVSYYLDFVPYYLIANDPLNTLVDWKINGTSLQDNASGSTPDLSNITTENNDETIKFTTGSVENQYYTLEADVTKYWSDDERNIAYSAWGVAPDTLSGNSSVNIATVAQAPGSVTNEVWGTSQAGPGQILAAVGTHLPHYFMYLLRLVLTMAVMFIVSAGFYGLSQNLNLADDEK